MGAKAALEQARCQVAALIGAENDEIIFTSGGSEANPAEAISLEARCRVAVS